MKLIKFSILVLFVLSIFSSCEKDDDSLPEGKMIENTELQTVLKTMGYKFDEANKLIMEDNALTVTSLDLSDKNLTDVSGLDIFPALEEVNLSNNKFGEFDFAQLPANITKIDLQGNVIYEFKNLNNDRNLLKLYLPETAKYNMTDLLDYYKANKQKSAFDIQINMGGSLTQYTTLRDVPDANLLAELKTKYPSVFDGDKIDISKEMTLAEGGNGLLIGSFFGPFMQQIATVEGVQYIMGFKNFSSFVYLFLNPFQEMATIDYLKIPESATQVILSNLDFTDAHVDWSNMKEVDYTVVYQVKGLKKLDLSASTKFGVDGHNQMMNGLNITNSPDLEEIILPNKEELSVSFITLDNLPKLKSIDLSKVVKLNYAIGLKFTKLPICEILFPTNLTEPEGDSKYTMAIDQSIKEKTTGKIFIDKYSTYFDIEILNNTTGRIFTERSVANSTISGNYTGVLNPVMNGKTYNSITKTFKLTERAGNKMDIYLAPFRVGSMPGDLRINIKNASISTTSNGDVTFSGSQLKCVILKLSFFEIKMDGNFSGNIKTNNFDFKINSKYNSWFGSLFEADVTFNGSKN